MDHSRIEQFLRYQLADLKTVTLREYCRSIGVSQAGSKAVLASRIYDSFWRIKCDITLSPGGSFQVRIDAFHSEKKS